MSNKYNQFIQAQMKKYQPDKEKLIKIASFLRQEYSLTVQREAILTFHKDTGVLEGFSSWLTEEQFHKYTIHVPDLLFFVGNKMWVFEIDGYIHNTNSKVVRKDKWRNDDYKRAKLNYMIINEWEILQNNGKNPDRSATHKEVIAEIKKLMKKII